MWQTIDLQEAEGATSAQLFHCVFVVHLVFDGMQLESDRVLKKLTTQNVWKTCNL